MKISAFFLAIMLLLTGCSSSLTTEKNLLGTWRLYDVASLKDSKEDDSFTATANLQKLIKEGDVISFFEDDSYTNFNGATKYKTGKWNFTTKNNVLNLTDSGKIAPAITIKIEGNQNGKEVLSLSLKEKNVVLKYIKEGAPLKTYTDDPFYTKNNLWRIKPQQVEDTAALSNRLNNYVKHVALILKAAKERKQNIVSFEFSIGPIKIYDGGIGIHDYNIVPDNWKNCFYNDADALAAYRYYEKYLINSKYKGAGTGDWIEDDYKILLAIYAGLTETKSND